MSGDVTTSGGDGLSLVKGVQVVLKAVGLSIKPGGEVGSITVGGRIATSGDGVNTVEIEGLLKRLEVVGGISAGGKGADAVHVTGDVSGLDSIELQAADGQTSNRSPIRLRSGPLNMAIRHVLRHCSQEPGPARLEDRQPVVPVRSPAGVGDEQTAVIDAEQAPARGDHGIGRPCQSLVGGRGGRQGAGSLRGVLEGERLLGPHQRTVVQGVDPQCAAVGNQVDAWPDSGRGEPPQPTSEPGRQQLPRYLVQ